MRNKGLQSLFPMEEISIMGLWELLPHIYNIKVQCCSVSYSCFAFCSCSLDLYFNYAHFGFTEED